MADENVKRVDPRDEILGPVVIDKTKKIEFVDVNLMRKKIKLTEKKIESLSISNEAEESI